MVWHSTNPTHDNPLIGASIPHTEDLADSDLHSINARAPIQLRTLIANSKNPDPLVRRTIACALSASPGEEEAIRSCLQEMMNDPVPAIALQAAVSLASQPGPRDPNLYVECTNPDDHQVYASEVLGAHNPSRIAHELKQICDNAFSNEILTELWSHERFKRCLTIDTGPVPRHACCKTSYLVMAIRPKESDLPVGFLVAATCEESPKQILIENLALRSEYRGRQLAANLLSHAEKLFAHLGYTTLAREAMCRGGWAARLESNLVKRGVLVSRETIQASDGRKVRMVMRLGHD